MVFSKSDKFWYHFQTYKLGSNGPPIPDPVEFSIISFPNDRTVENDTHDFQYFNFVAYGTDDPNIAEEDRLADEEAERTNLEDELKQATAAAKKTKKRGKSAKGKTAAKPETPPGGHTEKVLHLAKYRWVIQPKQSTKIRVRFVSDKLGEIKAELKNIKHTVCYILLPWSRDSFL